MINFHDITFLIAGKLISAQDISVEWVKPAGGINFDAVNDLQTDNENNLFVTGVFSGETVFENKKLISTGNQSVFAAEYNSEGELIWAQKYGSQGDVSSKSLSLNSKGEIFICGSFKESFTFGNTTIKSSDFSDNYLAKLDNKGNPLWIKHIITDSKGKNTFVVCDQNDNLYYAGTFYKSIEFEIKTLKAESSSDIFLAKYDKNGVFSDAITISGFNGEELNDLKCDTEGNIYLTGSFKNEIKFSDALFTSKGREDIFIAKFSDLNFEWAKQAGGFYKDYGKEIFIKDDKIYLAGNFAGTAKFDKKEIISTGVLDAFISCYSNKGKLLWLNSFGGTANDYVASLSVNNNKTIYISGTYRGKLGGEENETESKNFSSDIFTAKFSSKGKYISAISFGGEEHDFASSIFTDSENYIYQTGEFDKSLEFKEDIEAKGNDNDVFITKYYDCEAAEKIDLGANISIYADSYTIEPEGSFVSYEWSNGTTEHDLTVYESGEYALKVIDENNCVSEDTVIVDLYDQIYPEQEKDESKENDNKDEDITLPLIVDIYPNPTHEEFYFNLQNINISEKLYIEIVDENGKKVFEDTKTVKSTNITNRINLGNISSGIFHIIIINGKHKTSEKLVIYK